MDKEPFYERVFSMIMHNDPALWPDKARKYYNYLFPISWFVWHLIIFVTMLCILSIAVCDTVYQKLKEIWNV